MTTNDLRSAALDWFARNPGADAEALAKALGISPVEASNVTESLLNEGQLDFA